MDEVKIERNVPMPVTRPAGRLAQTLQKMKVGDSFLLPTNSAYNDYFRRREKGRDGNHCAPERWHRPFVAYEVTTTTTHTDGMEG